MGTEVWRVHTWQLNIGVGDSAIHLLVDERAGLGGTPKPVVQRAVLIDGGEGLDSWEKIWSAMTKIEEVYAFPLAANNQLRFDSIVITHWDSDHYQGILGLLQADYRNTIETDQTYVRLLAQEKHEWRKDVVEHHNGGTVADTDVDSEFMSLNLNNKQLIDITDELTKAGKGPWQYVAPLDTRIVVRSRFMKYGPAYPVAPTFANAPTPVTPITPDQLLTTLYVPYRISEALVGPDSKRNDKNLSMSCNLDNTYVKRATRTDTHKVNTNWLSCTLPTTFNSAPPLIQLTPGSAAKLAGGGPRKLSYGKTQMDHVIKKTWQILYCCKLAGDFYDYLGAELFFGSQLPAEYNVVKNPAELLLGYGLLRANGPRMYCVAGDQVVIGATALASYAAKTLAESGGTTMGDMVTINRSRPATGTSLRPFRTAEDVIDPSAGSLATRWTDYRADSLQKNSASLVCVILAAKVTVWTTTMTADQQRDSFRVLQYTAGDALFDEEGAVAGWLQNHGAKWPIKPVSVMKVSQ